MTKKITKTLCNGGVYRITCTESGKSYIGSTKCFFKVRWKRHEYELNKKTHRNTHMQRSWDKYGKQSFKFYELEPVQYVEDLIDREQAWIDIYQACDRAYGFNIAPRADRTCQSAESIEKSRLANIGRKHTPETKARMREIKMTPESQAFIRAVNSGRKRSPEHIAKMYQGRMASTRVSERRANAAAARKGVKQSPEEVAKRMAARIKNLPFYYCVVSPNGTVYDSVLSLNKFCQAMGLTGSCMATVARGVRENHKGWTCKKVMKANHP